tara:strand:- start:50 stop:382 length:333 start_codon:yes stop_codon:yes gene_type:complete
MIFYGKLGSLILFYNDLLIGSYPLSNLKTYERYKFQGEYLILKSLKQNIPLKLQIKTYRSFCHEIYKRKQNKQGIHRSDYEMFLSSLFALIKMKQIDEDESIYIAEHRKK